MFKRINAEHDITGALQKRWEIVTPDYIEWVSYEDWKASPLPDMTERDFFGGIIYRAA